MPVAGDFQAQWRERLASGSKLAAKALGNALRDDDSRVGMIAALTHDSLPTVRVAAYRALDELAASRPLAVAAHAGDVVAGLAAPEPDAQTAALSALAHIAPHARAEAALALPLIAELLASKRPTLREEAVKCLGRLGQQLPDHAPVVAQRLGSALGGARNPRASMEAREILAALEGMLPYLQPLERASLASAVAPLRGHPNIQVRERAGRLSKQLGA